uniref:HMA domain-containing protein n=1 Tax=Aegilops tauschii subsp. strangulata TaxID=200361 RepID=A0A453B4T2_AEGTS
MADKISTVVLKVDLECARCYRKMRTVLCKIQDKMNIKTISFDEKSNAVTVSGPFDPDKLCRKLCCEAGRVIKEMHVNGREQKAEKPKDSGGKADKEKPKDGGGKADKEKPKDAAAAKPEKKVKFDDAPPATDAKPGKAMPPLPPGMSMADLGPLLEKMKQAKQQQGGGGGG